MSVTPLHPEPAGDDPSDSPADDGYAGPAELFSGEVGVADGVEVEVSLRGHFDPVTGRYRWYGRVASSPAVAELLATGPRTVRLRTPHAEVATTLSDVDPWGRPRVEGFGAAPFAVPTDVTDDAGTG